jgi:hypothetical protein
MTRKTARGFRIYSEFPDTYGTTVYVQQSSSVSPACWIYYGDPEYGKYDPCSGQKIPPALHLSPAQVRRLIRALTRFLESDA